MHLAVKTLDAIDAALEKDQGGRYREILGSVIPHIGDAFRGEGDTFRSHMGASLIGSECARSIWYSWRWVKAPEFPGRILRLFNRGHLEEARFIALLLMIGVEIYQQDSEGKQFRIEHANGHFGGSGDGVAIGLPDLTPGTAALLEFKTHGEKSFKDVSSKGVKASKFEHYVQMNVYMAKMGLAVGMYGAVNKNTDELYFELVTLDSATADQFLARGEKLIAMTEPPSRINESPGYWKCRFCDYRPICHSIRGAKIEQNCRTCVYSKPVDGGAWLCLNSQSLIPKELMVKGCQAYKVIPQL